MLRLMPLRFLTSRRSHLHSPRRHVSSAASAALPHSKTPLPPSPLELPDALSPVLAILGNGTATELRALSSVSSALIGGGRLCPKRNPDGSFDLIRIGDAIASRNIHAAIYDGLRYALRV